MKLIAEWEKNNLNSIKLQDLEKQISLFKEKYQAELEKEEEEEAKKALEQAKNEFWITTPNYNSLNWGSKTVKLEWTDEDGELITDKVEMNGKVVKLGDNWFKMVKLNYLPSWLQREREQLISLLYLPTKKSQEQIALLQFKKVGSWELVSELKIAPEWNNSSKIRWLVKRDESN